MRILVTGATGNLGLAVTAMAVRAGHQARALVRNPTAFQARSPERRVELHAADVLDRAAVAAAFEGVDAAIHCVGFPTREVTRHWDAVRHILEALEPQGQLIIPAPGVARDTAADTGGASQPAAKRAPSPAGTVRRDLEKAVLAAGGTVVHMPCVYGPRVERGWLAGAFQRALAGKPVWYPGDLDAPVEYLYIDDAARALIAPLGRDVARGVRYTAAGPEVTTAREFFATLSRAAGRPSRLRKAPRPWRWVVRLLGIEAPIHCASEHLARSTPLDRAGLRDTLGWMPEVVQAEGIRRTVRWLRQRSSVTRLKSRGPEPSQRPARPEDDRSNAGEARSESESRARSRFAPPAE